MTLRSLQPESHPPTAGRGAADEAARYSREREAHNKYFSEGTRKVLDKYYSTTGASRASYEGVLRAGCRDAATLEYGCGTGSHSVFLAHNGATRVVGIDLSDVAIVKARESAQARGVTHAEYLRMNAEALEFPDNSFDLICGTAILHHLDLSKAFGELARVLKPGGTAAFLEPLGHNAAINMYRRLTPHLRTIDEHPLLMKDLTLARSYFSTVAPAFFGLHSLLASPLQGSRHFSSLLRILQRTDAALFRVMPFMKRYAWQVVLTFEQPVKRAAPNY